MTKPSYGGRSKLLPNMPESILTECGKDLLRTFLAM